MFVSCSTGEDDSERRELSVAESSESWAGGIGRIGVRLDPYGPRVVTELDSELRKRWTSSEGLKLSINLPSPSLEYTATCYLYAPDLTEIARFEFNGIQPEKSHVVLEDPPNFGGHLAAELSCSYGGVYLTAAGIINLAAADIASLNNMDLSTFIPRLIQARSSDSLTLGDSGVNIKLWVLPGEGPGVVAIAQSVRNLMSFFHEIPSLQSALPFFYGVSISHTPECRIGFVCDTSEGLPIVAQDPTHCPPVSPSMLTLVGVGVGAFMGLVAVVLTLFEIRYRGKKPMDVKIEHFYAAAKGNDSYFSHRKLPYRVKSESGSGFRGRIGREEPTTESVHGCWHRYQCHQKGDLLARASVLPFTTFSYWALIVHIYLLYFLHEMTLLTLVVTATLLHILINTLSICHIAKCPRADAQTAFGRVSFYVILLISLFNVNGLQLLTFAWFGALGVEDTEHQFRMLLRIEYYLPVYQLLVIKDVTILVSTALLQTRASNLLSILLIVQSCFSVLYVVVRGLAIYRSTSRQQGMKRIRSFARSLRIGSQRAPKATATILSDNEEYQLALPRTDMPSHGLQHPEEEPKPGSIFESLPVTSTSRWANAGFSTEKPKKRGSKPDIELQVLEEELYPTHEEEEENKGDQSYDFSDRIGTNAVDVEQTQSGEPLYRSGEMIALHRQIERALNQLERQQQQSDRHAQSQMESLDRKLNRLSELVAQQSRAFLQFSQAANRISGERVRAVADAVQRENEEAQSEIRRQLEELRVHEERRNSISWRNYRARGARSSLVSVIEGAGKR